MAFKNQLATHQLGMLDPDGGIHWKQDAGFIGCLRPEAQGALLRVEAEATAGGVLMGSDYRMQLEQIRFDAQTAQGAETHQLLGHPVTKPAPGF